MSKTKEHKENLREQVIKEITKATALLNALNMNTGYISPDITAEVMILQAAANRFVERQTIR